MSRFGFLTHLNPMTLSWVALSKVIHTRLITNALFLGGAVLLIQGLYMDVKASIAQGLIAYSWQQRTAVSPPPKPWWWADTNAIAKLKVSRLEKEVFIMQDDSGESLAFGPGHLTQSANISTSGHVMIAGHRDSHFEFLQDLQVGDVVETIRYDSLTTRYRIRTLRILDSSKEQLLRHDDERLTLITCYPFNDFIPGGPLRYIVDAERVDI